MSDERTFCGGCTRRELLARAAGAAALAGVSGGLGCFFHNRRLVPPPRALTVIPPFRVADTASEIVIARGNDGAALVRAALAELGGIARFIKPGDRVLVKPNCAFDRPPHLGATTLPEVLGEVVRQCVAAGAQVRVTDNPINDAEGCFAKSGLKDVTVKAGGELWLPAPALFRMTQIGTQKITAWDALATPLVWATKVICVPTVKSHNLCGASLAMKNWYGFLGAARARLHQSIDVAIADLGQFITPTLVVLDGMRLLLRNGPTGGSAADVMPGNVVAVGTDQVALDAFGAELLGLAPRDIGYLGLAAQQGVGSLNYSSLRRFREVTA